MLHRKTQRRILSRRVQWHPILRRLAVHHSPTSLQNFNAILYNQLRVQGLIVSTFYDKHNVDIYKVVPGIVSRGEIKYAELVVRSLDNVGELFSDVMQGTSLERRGLLIWMCHPVINYHCDLGGCRARERLKSLCTHLCPPTEQNLRALILHSSQMECTALKRDSLAAVLFGNIHRGLNPELWQSSRFMDCHATGEETRGTMVLCVSVSLIKTSSQKNLLVVRPSRLLTRDATR